MVVLKQTVHTHLSSWPGGHPSLVLPFAADGVCTGVERTMLREGARSVQGEVGTCQHMSTHALSLAPYMLRSHSIEHLQQGRSQTCKQ